MKPSPMLKEVKFEKFEDDSELVSAYNQSIDVRGHNISIDGNFNTSST